MSLLSKKILFASLVFALAGFMLWRFLPRLPGRTPIAQREFTDELVAGRPIKVIGPDHATIFLVGDIMLSRNVAAAIAKARDPLLPFRALGDLLLSGDLSVANLESPFSGNSVITPSGSLVFNAPTSTIAGLALYNFKILNLANNHALDQGEAGAVFTRRILHDQAIATYGTGENLDEAWQPITVELGGATIAFLGASYASYNDGGKTSNEYVARIDDSDRLRTGGAAPKEN